MYLIFQINGELFFLHFLSASFNEKHYTITNIKYNLSPEANRHLSFQRCYVISFVYLTYSAGKLVKIYKNMNSSKPFNIVIKTQGHIVTSMKTIPCLCSYEMVIFFFSFFWSQNMNKESEKRFLCDCQLATQSALLPRYANDGEAARW